MEELVEEKKQIETSYDSQEESKSSQEQTQKPPPSQVKKYRQFTRPDQVRNFVLTDFAVHFDDVGRITNVLINTDDSEVQGLKGKVNRGLSLLHPS